MCCFWLFRLYPVYPSSFLFFLLLLQFIVECHGNTLLPQFLGMYRLTVDGVEIYMIVTRNVFSHRLSVYRKYDLKVRNNCRWNNWQSSWKSLMQMLDSAVDWRVLRMLMDGNLCYVIITISWGTSASKLRKAGEWFYRDYKFICIVHVLNGVVLPKIFVIYN